MGVSFQNRHQYPPRLACVWPQIIPKTTHWWVFSNIKDKECNSLFTILASTAHISLTANKPRGKLQWSENMLLSQDNISVFSFFRETIIHYVEQGGYFPILSVRILKGLERVFFGTRGLYLLLCWKHPEHDRFFHLEFSQILDDTCNVQLQNCFHRSDHSLHSHKGKDLPLMQKNRQLNKLLLQSTSPVSCAELKQLGKE